MTSIDNYTVDTVVTVRQHGFKVKPVSIPTIREASPAEECGDEGSRKSSDAAVGPTLSSLWRAAAPGLPAAACAAATTDGHVEVLGGGNGSPGVRRLAKAVARGLRAGQAPEACGEGLGGTYFFMSETGRRIAIVKPCDEEPLAPNNPKGFVGRRLGDPGLKAAVRVGEAALREVAAFLLDHGHFAGVPHTALVRMAHPVFHTAAPPSSPAWPASSGSAAAMSGSFDSDISSATALAALPRDSSPRTNSVALGPGGGPFVAAAAAGPLAPMRRIVSPQPLPKLASLQAYVAHDCDTSELGASRFSVAAVHRIGILDLRLFNTDRHAGNMLVRQPRSPPPSAGARARLDSAGLELVPIDHGFCLPEALEAPYLEWLHWPQALIPFDEEELAYIARLDAGADAALLRRELPSMREESLRTLQVSTLLLKMGAAAGLSLAELGGVVSHGYVGLDEEPSDLEKLCAAARAEVDAICDDDGQSAPEMEEWEGGGEGLGAVANGPEGGELNGVPSTEDPGTLALLRSADSNLGSRLSGLSSCGSLRMSVELSPLQPRPADELLFDLEEDCARGGEKKPLPVPPPDAHGADLSPNAHPPCSAFAPVSPANSLAAALSYAPGVGGSEAAWPVAATSSPKTGKCGTGPSLAHAHSMAAAYKWPAVLQRHAQRRGRGRPGLRPACLRAGGGARRVPGVPGGRAAAPYPPPVTGGHEGLLNGVFVGLDTEEWAAFLELISESIADALAAGLWKQLPQSASCQGLGQSCPRF